ncbi:TetR/AcrR family transcriptional regulator [Nesterenkonia flava]|uniref:TetR/AcrR family transcriptional regulator n=1 Tax=Nesterenkonia flava TaxID=469799 RepID=A0ABU1FQJ9_9MICC|nr:TetR/AcrR family transcriptional regulator [Nesterenkonia flava]MDR5710642.1 TetR/AcrR family transcriptional regulator [Nesterenkonia flava]
MSEHTAAEHAPESPTPAEQALVRSLQLLWEGLPENSRGPRASLTLPQIITAAIEIADAEGLSALSMRRLAKELGVGTMSLYRYVPGKSELLNLMLDHMIALETDLPQGSWRELVEASAHSSRRLYLDHPWLLQVNWSRAAMGPNSIANMDVMVSALLELPISDQERIMLVSLIDGYVTGSVRQEIQYESSASDYGVSDDQFWTLQLPWLKRAMASGRYPAMAQLGDDAYTGGWDEQFAYGLRMLLDGIEQDISRR